MLSRSNPIRRILRQARQQANRSREGLAWWRRKKRIEHQMSTPPPLPDDDSTRDTTFVFMPYAGVGPMFAPACVIARTLQERGHRVIVARCYHLFERCPVMDMRAAPYIGGDEQKAELCLRCADNSVGWLETYGLEALDLRALVTTEMRERVRKAFDAAPENLLEFEFDGHPFGKLSAVDLILAKKIASLKGLPEELIAAWKQYIASSMLAYLLVDDVCLRYSIRRLVHVNDYTLSLAARLAAGKHGVPSYGVMLASHRNVDFRRYLILDNVWKPSSFAQLSMWPVYRELALSAERVREIGGDILVRLTGIGSHIYSPGKSTKAENLRDTLGIANGRKLLVAFTSSLDEVVATRMGLDAVRETLPERVQPFADQIEWLTALAEHAAMSPDLQLVIRIHPREGVNKNSVIQSEHLQNLRKAFEAARPYCKIVWPEDKISSYDLVEAADVVLTSWSTLGIESARMGVPVLVAFNGSWAAMPVDDFLEWGATRDEYFEKLRSLLNESVSLERISRSFRWYNLYHLGATLDFGDVVPSSVYGGLPDYHLPSEAATLEEVIIRGADPNRINQQRLELAQQARSAAEELTEIERQMRRLIHFIFTSEDSADDRPLYFWTGGTANPPAGDKDSPSAGRYLHLEGTTVSYWLKTPRGGGAPKFVRDSPMIARLTPLCGVYLNEGATSARRAVPHGSVLQDDST